jgi:hypothetical protein
MPPPLVRRRLAPRGPESTSPVLTALLYLAPDAEDLHAHLNTREVAFNTLGEKDPCGRRDAGKDQLRANIAPASAHAGRGHRNPIPDKARYL